MKTAIMMIFLTKIQINNDEDKDNDYICIECDDDDCNEDDDKYNDI